MRYKLPILICLLALLGGCSSHEKKFSDPDDPEKASARAIEEAGSAASAAAGGLIVRYENRVNLLPVEVLAPLAQASALEYEATNAPGVRQLAIKYANALLLERPLFSDASKQRLDPYAAAAATEALLDVYRATESSRYRAAAADAATIMTTPRAGWTIDGKDEGVAAPGNTPGLDIPATAVVSSALGRAAREANAPVARQSVAGFKTVVRNQAALGRWWVYTGGRKIATNLEQWATILKALAAAPDGKLQGIAGGGVPALKKAVFDEDGGVRDEPDVDVTPLGLAFSLQLLETFSKGKYASDPQAANAAFAGLVSTLRPDGTSAVSGAADEAVQAQVALALAQRARDLRPAR
jgi:hypothetical protein